ncbi:hypothetical protein [Vibrio furnissii]|uniref:hypothetical protein n=1 Tax=Vibrio furnissii TaxID=29494 RepID=UPI001EEB3CE5|nr:hypothetical protein [Vibrio furnissii]MCG6231515.1 hypothetical protein [Vibrio furnissii]MCG6261440.1 hypothetical protein [Vibrio furnissii]
MSINYKVIREFYRHFNFTSSSKDRKKCQKSVIHTLRILALLNSNKPILDWNPELNDKNFILTEGEIIPLHLLSDERKMELLQDIVPPPKIKNKKELQKNFTSLDMH